MNKTAKIIIGVLAIIVIALLIWHFVGNNKSGQKKQQVVTADSLQKQPQPVTKSRQSSQSSRETVKVIVVHDGESQQNHDYINIAGLFDRLLQQPQQQQEQQQQQPQPIVQPGQQTVSISAAGTPCKPSILFCLDIDPGNTGPDRGKKFFPWDLVYQLRLTVDRAVRNNAGLGNWFLEDGQSAMGGKVVFEGDILRVDIYAFSSWYARDTRTTMPSNYLPGIRFSVNDGEWIVGRLMSRSGNSFVLDTRL